MTDEDLAVEICPDNPCLGLVLICGMTSAKRATLQRLVEVGRELNLHAAGLGPAPAGVIVNRGRSRWYNKDRVR